MATSDDSKAYKRPAKYRLDTGERPTLKTVARLSGFAVPTVSRALSDAPDISSATKKKVREVAAEIGYIPNRAGVRLRTGKTNVIALMLSGEVDLVTRNAQLIQSIYETLRGTPYHLIVMPKAEEEDPMEPVRYIVETGSADGIIMNQTEQEDARAEYLLQRGFPFATHGVTKWADQHAHCDYDNEAFARLAIRTLSERGRKNILTVLPEPRFSFGQHLRRGAGEEADVLGVSLRETPGISSDNPVHLQEAGIEEALRADPGIDGILAAAPGTVMAATAAAERQGRRVGEDIDIIGKEAIRFLKLFRPSVLVVHEDVGEAGHFLARAILHAIEKPGEKPMQLIAVPTGEVD